MSDTHLAIWLDDHLGIAVGLLELARRCRKQNPDPPFGERLDHVTQELETERTAIEDVLADLGTEPSRLKQVAGWLAEKAGRIRLNERLTSYSPLSRLEELEALMMGVASLAVMWRSLQRVRGDDAKPGGVDLERRASAAEALLDELRTLVAKAADEALATA